MIYTNGHACVVCKQRLSRQRRRAGAKTCGAKLCHEAFVKRCEREFGPKKRVVDLPRGKVYEVPLRDIIEKGIKQKNLPRYPEVEPTPEEAMQMEEATLIKIGMVPEIRDGKPGLVFRGHFFPSLQDLSEISTLEVIVTRLRAWGPGLPGAIEKKCSDCHQAVVISPTTQPVLEQRPDLPVVCMECMEKRAEAEEAEKAKKGGEGEKPDAG